MKVNLKASSIELNDDTINYVQKKIDMLEKYLGSIDILNCDVEIGMSDDGKNHRTEVNLQVKNKLIRVVKEAPALYKSIDKTKDHLAQSIKKYKGKLQ